MSEKIKIVVEARIKASLEKVWGCWVTPQDIVQWNAASADWHTVSATNDLRVDGEFSFRMEAKDGSFGFDFQGKYTTIEPMKTIAYRIIDDRLVEIRFKVEDSEVWVEETFEAESMNPVALQEQGWQAILNNFKLYVESKK
ncbi:MAG: SRPBCC domain-containing protein [Bacteroidetes bacterium]|nr:SRPBCC domain-containing protein [Bacteroidota bacterium]